MALVTKYVVEMTPETANRAITPFPAIFRIIEVDGAEVSRGMPNFREVTSASPETIPLYFDALRDFFTATSTWLDDQSSFTAETLQKFIGLRRVIAYYINNFDTAIDGFNPGDQIA